MRKNKIFLNLLMFIGVGVTLLHFFSTPVHADSGIGNWHYSEVVDSYEFVGVRQYQGTDINSRYYVLNYAGYSHGEITITTDSENAFGVVSIYGKSYPYSGLITYHKTASTKVSWQIRTNTYDPGTTTPSSSPPFNLTDTRGSFTYNYTTDFDLTNLSYQGSTTDFSNYDTSTGHWVDPNIWFCFSQNTFSDNNTNDVYIMEVPIGNTTIKPEEIEIAYYSTFNNKPNKAILSNLYINQTVSKLYIYFTLNEDFAAWPYGTGILCLKANKRVYLYNNTFKFYKVKYQTDMYYELITDIKLWKFLDQYTDKPEESTHVDNSNSSFSSSSQQMMDLEDQLQGDFNSAIGNITVPTNPFNAMGVMFGNSSRFLVHMFDQMTISNGSPFGTVITFSLILGLALLMIGKKGSR